MGGGGNRQRSIGTRGFTLTELVLTLSIIGILSVAAAPRFLDVSTTDAQFFHREVIGALRHSRKLAVATNCPVQFALTVSGFTIRQRASCDSGSYTQPVFDPATGASGFSGTAPSGASFSSTLDPLYFDPLGRTVNSAGDATDVTITISGLGISAIGESGLIYEP
jgi:prepilin-type N-terminal cleavage/methylation domain-containing protein